MDYSEIHVDDRLDTGESGCGELLMLIFERMKTLQPGKVLEVVGYDAGAQADIPAWCRLTNNPLLHMEVPTNNTDPSIFLIQKGNDRHG